jgi:TolB-like protein/Tfp pilus assembly protein PilF
MAEGRVQRRLAAILAADVVGYSRLIEQDETGTLATLKERRKAILQPLVAEHNGRIVKVMGDGVLVEFVSAVDAVACAVELQKRMAAANDGVAEDRRILLRVGINLGDVVVEGSDLYGDGVIVAVRLQAMAEPGGVCLAGSVQEQVGNKLPLTFEDLGPCEVKNIAKPVSVFRVQIDGRRSKDSATRQTGQSRPSIAVLPFSNMSGDPEQEYFSDGITEDVITELSRYHSLLVIARNSAFQFRGSGIDTAAVRRKLGVGFVVEGSIRKIDSRLRITAQLIDAASESHLWAERYDRDVGAIFAVQDEIARAVAATVEGRIAAAGAERLRRKPTTDWAAYDYFLQGRELVNRYQMAEAERLLARAVDLDPAYVHAHAWRAIALTARYLSDGLQETLDQAFAAAERALTLDDNDAWSHQAMGYVCLRRRRLDLAGLHFDRALSLNPNDTNIVGDRANWLMYAGRLDEALQSLDAALVRDPYPPSWVWEVRGLILFHMRRDDEAIAALRRQTGGGPAWTPALLAATYAQSGRLDEARQEAARAHAADPRFTIAVAAAGALYTDAALRDQLLDALRKAGIPE